MYYEFFFNEMAFPFQPLKFQCMMRAILDGYDDLESKITEVVNEFYPEFCKDISNFSRERGLEKYTGESDSDFRERVIHAFEFFRQGITKPGVRKIISSLTSKEFTITEKFTGYFRIGSSKIGLSSRVSGSDFSGYIIYFSESLNTEEKLKIINSLDFFCACGIEYQIMEG